MGDASGQESVIAQTKIFQDFVAQKPFEVTDAMSTVEQQLRVYLQENTNKAFNELVSLGFNPHTLEPIKQGKTVVLDTAEKAKMTDHLLSIYNPLPRMMQFQELGMIDKDQLLWDVSEMQEAFAQETVINIQGPMITIKCTSPAAMDLYRFVSGRDRNNIGVSTLFPVGTETDENGEKTRTVSETLFLNLLDAETAKRTSNDTIAHERWHTIDAFRSMTYAHLRNRDLLPKVDALFEENPDRFFYRLEEFLYYPTDVYFHLSQLEQKMPEIYAHFFGTETSPEILTGNLLMLQSEVSAWIAGYIDTTCSRGISDNNAHQLLNNLLDQYFFLGPVNSEHLELLASNPGTNPVLIDDALVDRIFLSLEARFSKPHETLTAMLDAYSNKTDWSGRRDIYRKKEFTEHMQLLLDSVVNDTGYFTELNRRVRGHLYETVQAYQALSELRGNPYQALLELSLLPLSHWKIYVKRETTKPT